MTENQKAQREIDREEIKGAIEAMVRAYGTWKLVMVRSSGGKDGIGSIRTPRLSAMFLNEHKVKFNQIAKRYRKYLGRNWPEESGGPYGSGELHGGLPRKAS